MMIARLLDTSLRHRRWVLALWLAVLVEEVGEVGQAILRGERKNYREELVQVAAVALAAIQDYDWMLANRDMLPPPQIVASSWERAEADQEHRDG